jgi:hypothetical protein
MNDPHWCTHCNKLVQYFVRIILGQKVKVCCACGKKI